MRHFYVYRHIRLDTNTPFYVGKGMQTRAYSHKNRNKYWKRIVKTAGYKVEIIQRNLVERDAFELECKFIKLYKQFRMCEANLTLGGEGATGWIAPVEFVKACSERFSGKNNPMYGRKFTLEHRMKMSAALKGRTPWNKGLNSPTKLPKEEVAKRKRDRKRIRDAQERQKKYGQVEKLNKEQLTQIHRQATSRNQQILRSDGVYFSSIRDAARQMRITHGQISRGIKRNLNIHGFKFIKV